MIKGLILGAFLFMVSACAYDNNTTSVPPGVPFYSTSANTQMLGRTAGSQVGAALSNKACDTNCSVLWQSLTTGFGIHIGSLVGEKVGK